MERWKITYISTSYEIKSTIVETDIWNMTNLYLVDLPGAQAIIAMEKLRRDDSLEKEK